MRDGMVIDASRELEKTEVVGGRNAIEKAEFAGALRDEITTALPVPIVNDREKYLAAPAPSPARLTLTRGSELDEAPLATRAGPRSSPDAA
jgi:hypothetical protein